MDKIQMNIDIKFKSGKEITVFNCFDFKKPLNDDFFSFWNNTKLGNKNEYIIPVNSVESINKIFVKVEHDINCDTLTEE